MTNSPSQTGQAVKLFFEKCGKLSASNYFGYACSCIQEQKAFTLFVQLCQSFATRIPGGALTSTKTVLAIANAVDK